MTKAIPAIPTMPPKNPIRSASATASGRSTSTSDAVPGRGVTGSSSMTAPASARTAKISSSTRSGVSRETRAPTSDAAALVGPMSQTIRIETLP